MRPDNHLTGRNGCPLCSVKHSIWEKDVLEYIKSLETDVISGEKKILCGKELDIFITNKKIEQKQNVSFGKNNKRKKKWSFFIPYF